ncbi:YcxB family protein [Streptomyces sp. NPDC046261]|uniref:YcxB family protein n=1 Tax=Streptomyces sp. NPDC046261 TaxID=3157200 RepID=UPI00340E0541
MSHEISIFALRQQGPEDNVHPELHGQIRPLINGQDVIEDACPEGVTSWWQGIPLAATEAGRKVMLAAAECSTTCCGSVWVTIRREGSYVLWTDWENSGDGGKLPPEYRFEADQYDTELARATTAFLPQDTGRGKAVEFVFRPAAADFEEALRARARRTAAGRTQALLGPLMAAAGVAAFAVLRDIALPVLITALVLSVAAASWGTVRGLRTTARRMFSIVEPYGQCRVAADDRGMASTGERVSFTHDWTVFREYLETPGLFVLLGGERAAGVSVVPKRGAQDPADVDRFRVVLDRNLKRI